MKTCESPIEVWHSDENLRPFLKREKILKESESGKLSIPTFKCQIEKPDEKGKMSTEIRQFPFYHQKFLFMLEAMHGDFARAIESFNSSNRSFLCGKNMEITVTVL